MEEDKISRLKAIADLRESGILSEFEFQEQKAKIMEQPVTPSYPQQPFGERQQQYTGQGEPPLDEGIKILFYVVSFIIPIAGVIIGILYHSKPEPWHKEVGKNCLLVAVSAIIIGFILSILVFGAMLEVF